MRGNALFVAADKVHGHEPLDKGQFGVLEDSTDKAREVLEAVVATETSVTTLGAMVVSAIGANHVTVRPTRFDDGLLAFLLAVEVGCETDNVVELCEVNHSNIPF